MFVHINLQVDPMQNLQGLQDTAFADETQPLVHSYVVALLQLSPLLRQLFVPVLEGNQLQRVQSLAVSKEEKAATGLLFP